MYDVLSWNPYDLPTNFKRMLSTHYTCIFNLHYYWKPFSPHSIWLSVIKILISIQWIFWMVHLADTKTTVDKFLSQYNLNGSIGDRLICHQDPPTGSFAFSIFYCSFLILKQSIWNLNQFHIDALDMFTFD